MRSNDRLKSSNQGEAHGVARDAVARVAAGVDAALVAAIAHMGTTQPHIETRGWILDRVELVLWSCYIFR